MSYLEVILMLDATFRLATPLIFAALAGLYAERSGVFDIGLEGKMLGSAFAAAAAASLAYPYLEGIGWLAPWVGLAAGIAASIALAMLHGFACITHRGNQIVSGVAINILAAGLAIALGRAWFQRGGQTEQLSNEQRFTAIRWPGVETIGEVPVLGTIYVELISGHNLLVYLAVLAVPLTAFVVYRTRFGLRLRAVGENPAAVDTAGISVAWMRYKALIVTGILCGISGSYLSIAHGASFVPNMSAGKGFIALAALIFGKWRPYPAFFACLLFGFLEALEQRVQGASIVLDLDGDGAPEIDFQIPVQLFQAMPYIFTVVLLAGFIGRAVAPRAGGIPYVKER
ncbi:MAG: ABC transporter permease [Alphaproteobacteria bacterium]